MREIRFFKSILFKYLAVAVLPLAALLFQPTVNFAVLTLGARALLEARPVDPRDFLRGDYVTLDYAISDIPDALFPDLREQDKQKNRRTVYVTLALNGAGIASVSGVSLSRPKEGLYIRGSEAWHKVDYGLGIYYVPEGTGRAIENALRDPNVKVLADTRLLWGRGVIKKLEIVNFIQQP